MPTKSLLQELRIQYQPSLPAVLQGILSLSAIHQRKRMTVKNNQMDAIFPKTANQPYLKFEEGNVGIHTPKRVGVVLSGGQAAGGHNVITGLYDALQKLHSESTLVGFCNGPKGIIDNDYIKITAELLMSYRNQGGFDLLGSGRTKIETPEQFRAAESTVRDLKLDGLVVIGGDDSNTNAALLAEYFLQNGCMTSVIGVPKTIDGDLQNEDVEISFGFDSATKTYSEIIGNIMRDVLSAKKSYNFIKLMGRSASHVTLECALRTHPNMALIGEEVAAERKTLLQIVQEMCDLICARSSIGKNYGIILIPEGIIEFIPEFNQLISELNNLLVADKPHAQKIENMVSRQEKVDYVRALLTSASADCFKIIPFDIQQQLLLDRDPHGNVQVSKIETERMFIDMVKQELSKRKKSGNYTGKFSAQPYFCGYEGRSCLPSNFDAQYCYSLGYVAALLVDSGATAYICYVSNLHRPIVDWEVGGRPLVTMMAVEKRHGQDRPVIGKALVDLHGRVFTLFRAMRKGWSLEDDYGYPGPIQFFGPTALTEEIPLTLAFRNT